MQGVQWPVTFITRGGQRFTVEAPERSGDGAGLVMRLSVDGDGGCRDYVVGPVASPSSAGGVIGRTLRWWWETRHESLTLADPPR